MLKITKYNDYRLNFVLDGLHYSLSENDGYDGYCLLQCKENDEFEILFFRDYLYNIMSPFVKNSFKQGRTYNQMIYLEEFEKFIEEILSGVKYKNTKAYEKRKEYEKQKTIEYYLRELDRLNYKVVSIGAYEQVAWERDVAIDQLKQLGYGLGEKIDKLSDKQKIGELEDVVASLQCQIENLEDTIDILIRKLY